MKQLKPKHLRKLKLNELSDSEKRRYVASYSLGLCMSIEVNENYKPLRINDLNKNPQTFFQVYKAIASKYPSSRNRLTNLGYYLKIARHSQIAPSTIFENTRYSSQVGPFISDIKAAIFKKNKRIEKSAFEIKKEKYLAQYKIGAVTKPDHLDASLDYIGLEVECFVNEDTDIKYIAEKMKIKNLSIKSDGSISPDDGNQTGVEFTMLLKKTTLKKDLESFCEYLKVIKAKVNSSCGLHVHLDMRKKSTREITTIAKRLGASLPVLKNLVPRSRRSNQYCAIGVSKRNGGRYYAINLTSLKKYNTIEVRLHSGTVDFDKIFNWISLLDLIVQTKTGKAYTSLDDLADKTSMSDNLLDFYLKRLEKFKDDSTENNIGYELTDRANNQDEELLEDLFDEDNSYDESNQEGA